jgi:hypothetical protein
MGKQGHGDCVYLAAGQLPRINWLLKVLVHGSVLRKLRRLAAGAAASRRLRRRQRRRRRRRRRRRERHLRLLPGIILLRLFRLVLRIVIAKPLPMKRKSGTAIENE